MAEIPQPTRRGVPGSRLRRHRQTLPRVVLAVSAGIHAWALAVILLPGSPLAVDFTLELASAVAFAGILEVVIFTLDHVVVFRVAVFLRLLALLVVHGIVGSAHVGLCALLAATHFVDVIVYDDGLAERVIVVFSLLVLFGVLVTGVDRPPDGSIVSFVGAYLLTLGLVVGFAAAALHYRESLARASGRVRDLERTAANLAHANRAFQLYAEHAESESAEKERKLIIGRLHDTVGYALTNVTVMMKAGQILLEEDPRALKDVLVRVGAQSEDALNDVRQTLHQMRAIETLQINGLREVYALTRAFQGATGITVAVHRGNLPWSLGPRLDSIVFRVVQEGLTNAFRHGNASEVSVFCWQSEKDIRVSVRDNGRGMESIATAEEGLGLAGIRERLAEVGGTVSRRNLNRGFELEVSIPYRMGEIGATHQSTDR